jgi:hypothetical protein
LCLHKDLLELSDVGLAQLDSHRAQSRVEMRIHVAHVLLVLHLDEDGLFPDCVVEAVEVQEIHFVFVRFLELADAHHAGGELVAGFVCETVELYVGEL